MTSQAATERSTTATDPSGDASCDPHGRQGDAAGIGGAARVIVKVGSTSLTTPDGVLALEPLRALVDSLAARRLAGVELVLVSSGAVAAGILPLGLGTRPRDLATQQAAASVGQGALVAAYTAAFARHGLTVGQVLLTADDLIRKQHYVNARRAVSRLLRLGVVPVVNENDAVATDEIRFGDNDRLAALVAHLTRADALLLLSDVDALYDRPPAESGAARLDLVRSMGDLAGVRIEGTGSTVGTGGMMTKVDAARIATGAGIPTLLTSASNVSAALDGAPVGTLFTPTAGRPASRMLWLAHASEPQGRLVIDDGAVRALLSAKASLLPAGVMRVSGAFEEGAPVEVVDRSGQVVARGLVNYSSEAMPRLLGRTTHWLGEVLGVEFAREIIHRDQLVVLHRAPDR